MCVIVCAQRLLQWLWGIQGSPRERDELSGLWLLRPTLSSGFRRKFTVKGVDDMMKLEGIIENIFYNKIRHAEILCIVETCHLLYICSNP
jgi:hypothetical protein